MQNRKNWQTITKIKPFINKIDWKGIYYLSRKGDKKIFEKKNPKIARNVLYTKKWIDHILPIFENNSNYEKRIP